MIKKVVTNNIKMLKLVWSCSPAYVLIMLASSVFGVYEPLVNVLGIKTIIDGLASGKSFEYLFSVVLGIFLLMLLSFLYNSWLNNYYIVKSKEIIKKKLTMKFIEKLRSLDLSCYDDTAFYDNYTRASSEANQRPLAVLDTLVMTVTTLFTMGTVVALMTTMDAITIIFAVINVSINLFFSMKQNKKQYELSYEKTYPERRKDYYYSLFSGSTYAKEIRASNVSDYLFKEYASKADDLINLIKRKTLKFLKLYFGGSFSNAVYTGVMFTYFIYIAVTGKTSVGAFAALMNAVGQLSSSIFNMMNYIPQFYQHSLFTDNLNFILNYTPKIEGTVGEVIDSDKFESISLNNVSFAYPGMNNNVLNNVNIKINKGETVAIVGPNGAGKTTLVKIMMRYYDPGEGTVLINGNDAKSYSVASLRDLFGIVFQDYKYFAFTIAENVLQRKVQNEQDERLVWRALEKSGLAGKVRSLPKGIYTELSKEFDPDGVVLSGGEIQKLALATVFAKNSSIILMDEPSSALDPVAEHELFNKLLEVTKNKTVILISHRLANVCNADSIYLIENGRIVEEGTHRELMNLNGKYAYMFKLQAEKYISSNMDNVCVLSIGSATK